MDRYRLPDCRLVPQQPANGTLTAWTVVIPITIAGVIDTKTNSIEHPELVADRIDGVSMPCPLRWYDLQSDYPHYRG